MSKTSRTDAEAMDGEYRGQGSRITLQSWDYKKDKDGEVVPAEFARQLETELDEARVLNAELLAALKELHNAEWLNLPGRAGDIIESAIWKAEGRAS